MDTATPLYTQEVQEFFQGGAKARPQHLPAYRHNMYLYVRSLSNKTEARKWSDKFRARNLCVRVQLRDNDSEVGLISDNSATVRKAVYGKHFGDDMVHSGYTEISHHDRTPRFGDEVKIRLPPPAWSWVRRADQADGAQPPPAMPAMPPSSQHASQRDAADVRQGSSAGRAAVAPTTIEGRRHILLTLFHVPCHKLHSGTSLSLPWESNLASTVEEIIHILIFQLSA